MSREAMKMALEALVTCCAEEWRTLNNFGMKQVYDEKKVNAAIAALHAALAEPERQWISLTEQEMYDLFFHDQYGPRLPEYLVNTIKCVEAALKEKNSGS